MQAAENGFRILNLHLKIHRNFFFKWILSKFYQIKSQIINKYFRKINNRQKSVISFY